MVNVFDSIPQRVAAKYRDELFGDATLQDLPDPSTAPRFVFYATSLQSGASVRMSRKYLADYRVGRIPNPTLPTNPPSVADLCKTNPPPMADLLNK